jgi:hypothetical protein
MSFLVGNELFPYPTSSVNIRESLAAIPQEMFSDPIRSSRQNVMRIDIVVSETGYNGDIFRYDLHHLVDHHGVEVKDFLRCSGKGTVDIVPAVSALSE